jgi:RNA polymerase sigma-70 factor (ECF subfamily)
VDDRDAVQNLIECGDPESFRFLVDRYKGRVLRLVSSILGPGLLRDVEDVVQEVFLCVYQKISRFRGDSAFATWLYRVTYNTAIDHRRRSVRHEALYGSDVLEAVAGARPAISTLDRQEIVRQVERLPDPYRTAVYLHYWYGSSVVEIGELLGAKPNTVKSYLFRARQRLGRSLESGESL